MGVDSGTISLGLAALLLLSGLWAEVPLERLAGQSLVLGIVFLVSLFRTFPLRTHSIQPRLPPVRSLVGDIWTLVDANDLDPEDKIQVQTENIIPTACAVLN